MNFHTSLAALLLALSLLLGSATSACSDYGLASLESDVPGGCEDGADNDGDGLLDCDDPDCDNVGSCPCRVLDGSSEECPAIDCATLLADGLARLFMFGEQPFVRRVTRPARAKSLGLQEPVHLLLQGLVVLEGVVAVRRFSTE